MPDTLKKILIADDDEAIVDATSLMLEVMGYEVSKTRDGKQVPDAIQNRPDLLLLDIWMSGIDGRDICRQMKSDPLTKDIPVLMISASRDVRQSALDSGADDFLEKPFEMDTLVNKVVSLIGV
ncbi:response regulator [Mucilaginibacter xinganensis]|uniref:Response regulator n=1 Tax=Mucilaginibacter xinganensis TaxID=1234841 RepID=A0A223NTF9_9SPHI|nr:response regulator [Mucilaginibacter xinganensis]ASU33116.1 response regulator [Mucilaginibacter xinganensis]